MATDGQEETILLPRAERSDRISISMLALSSEESEKPAMIGIISGEAAKQSEAAEETAA
jgi:hypothetical protein